MSNSREAALATIVPYPIFKDEVATLDTNASSVTEQSYDTLARLYLGL